MKNSPLMEFKLVTAHGETTGRRKVGFVVNPIAGMGGRVGLKGTDGEAYRKALELGAKPVSPGRARRFLRALKASGLELLTAPGVMGGDYVSETSIPFRVVGSVGTPTTAEDTVRVCREMVDEGVELIVFVGGDGTARDVCRAVGTSTPTLGVPSGVKVYSSVFAYSPEEAAEVVSAFLEGRASLAEREVLDVDEEAFRRGVLRVRLYGFLRVPVVEALVQPSKTWGEARLDVEENKRAIARYLVEEMEEGVLYILGPGTTLMAVAEQLGVEKTPLGVDAVVDGRLVGRDLSEGELLRLLDRYPRAKVVVSPLGGQGFILGRGNQQISPEVLRRVGRENIIVLATKDKMAGLKVLRVDTGDPEVDRMLRGYMRVIVDYMEERVVRVA